MVRKLPLLVFDRLRTLQTTTMPLHHNRKRDQRDDHDGTQQEIRLQSPRPARNNDSAALLWRPQPNPKQIPNARHHGGCKRVSVSPLILIFCVFSEMFFNRQVADRCFCHAGTSSFLWASLFPFSFVFLQFFCQHPNSIIALPPPYDKITQHVFHPSHSLIIANLQILVTSNKKMCGWL